MNKVNDILFKIASPNMDIKLCDWLNTQDLFDKSCVSSIYYPVWKEHGNSARTWTNNDIDDWTKYKYLLLETKDAGFQPEVLLQGEQFDPQILDIYLNLGVKVYTVSSDKVAQQLKNMDPSVYTIASITKVLSPDEIQNEDLSMYDEICLYFYFQANLSEVEKLPDTFNYSICCNSGCAPNCIHCLNHWFSTELWDCRYSLGEKPPSVPINYQEWKKYFSPKVKKLKVLDRLNKLETIKESLTAFFSDDAFCHDRDFFDRKMPFPNILNKDMLKERNSI